MANQYSQDTPEPPDLDEFARKIDAAVQSTEQFAETLSSASAVQAGTQPRGEQQNLEPALRDLLSAMDMIHSELVALHETLRSLTE